jgi:succinate dehydrogenase/fumarate reductase flavoprotein subunit
MAQECDLLVIGSGAAGMCAAVTGALLGLDVVLVEKAPVLGGTTAWSGGWMWLPRNALAQVAGIVEPRSAPRDYLAQVLGNRFDPARIDAFIDTAPAMVDFLIQNGFVFEAGNRICDIYGALPGAGTGGRSLIAAAYDATALGERLALLRRTKRETSFLGMPIQAGPDLGAFLNATRRPSALAHVARRLLRHGWEMARHGRATTLLNGVALIARLFAMGEAHGVRWRVNAAAAELLTRDGRVCGAALQDGEVIKAHCGVVLATGGVSASPAHRAALFPHAQTHETLAVPEADGAGLALAAPLGADFADDLAANGAWCPVSRVAWPDGTKGIFPHIIERGKPGLIAVLANGRRFVNEADGYHDFVRAMLAATPQSQTARAWLICDHRFIRRWGLGVVRPAPLPLGYWVKSGYLYRAPTLAGLAQQIGIDPQLAQTVADYNLGAYEGRDDAFGRGSTPYNRYQGDPERQPNPNVAPIEHAPFYAVEVLPGSFGSFAGLKTDAQARVLQRDGAPIPGLFAAGADMASIMGGHYPAGGINLGPAMVFGHIAATTAAQA